MRYGSVCSGIEAASVAWESLGWEAQWYSEIEPFPSAVLAHRFPTVPNLGDMTKIHETEIFNGKTIDLLVGGTPCQSFSVAGLRKGLTDPRGNLMLTFLGLAERKKPRWLVWENVPGVLSSNGGRDFATFLTALGELGYGFAYRILDAQYFGVAQRRRRVFVVAYLGDWRPCASVLFESDCLQGNSKESKQKRKATSIDAQGGSGGSSQSGVKTYAGNIESDVAATLQTSCDDYSRADGFNVVAHAFKVRGGSETETGEQGGTPGKKAGKGYLGQDEKVFTIGTTQDQQIMQPIAYENHAQDSRVREMGETCTTVSANYGTGGGNIPLVKQAVAVDCYNQTVNHKTTQTIGSSASDVNHVGAVLQPKMAIRRLTPKECERLQGFPDDWTLIPYRNKSADQCPDGPRYKACGNSMAVPVMRWIGQRIEMVEKLIADQ